MATALGLTRKLYGPCLTFSGLHGNAEDEGTGVGLSIVQKMVENHGGYMGTESEPGKGAAFFVWFPTA